MDETLGERIKRLREVRRLTQQQLADALGVSTKTVSNWEGDKNDPRNSLGALREFFGPAFDAGDASADKTIDALELALRESDLSEWRQGAVVNEYRRQVFEQQREERTG